jgi:hypothetical protein
MDHIQILKRSLHNAWRYKALWIFGIVLALTTFSWESASENLDLEFQESYTISDEQVVEFFRNEIVQMVLAVIVLVTVVIILLSLLALLFRYLSETALIKMVNDYEKTGTKYSVWQGLRMAWSRSAWRLFLIDLTVRLPAILLFLVLVVLIVAPIIALASSGTTAGVAGAIAFGGFFFLLLALAIVAAAVLGVLARLARQASVVDSMGVVDSIRRGYEIVRYNLKDVGLMWLIMVGVNLIWPFLMIPVVILLIGIGVIVVAIVVGLIGGLGALATAGAGAWIMAGVLAAILFLLILIAPLALLTGMRAIFESSAWTLTYRDLKSAGHVKVKSEPKPAAI